MTPINSSLCRSLHFIPCCWLTTGLLSRCSRQQQLPRRILYITDAQPVLIRVPQVPWLQSVPPFVLYMCNAADIEFLGVLLVVNTVRISVGGYYSPSAELGKVWSWRLASKAEKGTQEREMQQLVKKAEHVFLPCVRTDNESITAAKVNKMPGCVHDRPSRQSSKIQ